MAFWGIEVKPGKPFTHTSDDAKGRLHISQATLGIGTATKKSVVQCNVGSRSPVFLCSLFPETAESSQLNLEYEEADEVVFSVLGPRSVHLTGYYLSSGRHYNLHDESESYGQDIAETETERSTGNSEEDDYEDSFIDDSDPKVVPSSPVSNDEVIEDSLDKKKSKNGKGRSGRLRKKYQLIESDDDGSSQEQMFVGGHTGVLVLDSESEDRLPISSLYKSNAATKNTELKAEERGDKEAGETGNNETKDDGNCVTTSEREASAVVDGEPNRGDKLPHSALPSTDVGPNNGAKPKKKRKERAKDGKRLACHGNVVEEAKADQDEAKTENLYPDMPVRNEQNHKQANDDNRAGLPHNCSLPSTQVGPENSAKPKRKRKEWVEERTLEADSAHNNSVTKVGKAKQHEPNSDSMGQNLPVKDEQNQKHANNRLFDNDADQFADGIQSEEKKKKKRKKKSKTQENGEATNMEIPLSSTDEKNRSVMDIEDNYADGKSSHLRTMSNGLIIEELETGKPDGKIAAPGKKISVNYIGKLKENGQVFDSNVGGSPFKFRLGRGGVVEGWNVGLDGMRVGDKRRLVIPPSLGYGNEGNCENIPPNSWLVYDVELVKVR